MPSSYFMETLILIIIGLLLPVIPAFILFKAFPSRAVASGPLAGLRVNVGGAYAGYFILALPILLFTLGREEPPEDTASFAVYKVRLDVPQDVEVTGDVAIEPPIIDSADGRSVDLVGVPISVRSDGRDTRITLRALEHQDVDLRLPFGEERDAGVTFQWDHENHIVKVSGLAFEPTAPPASLSEAEIRAELEGAMPAPGEDSESDVDAIILGL